MTAPFSAFDHPVVAGDNDYELVGYDEQRRPILRPRFAMMPPRPSCATAIGYDGDPDDISGVDAWDSEIDDLDDIEDVVGAEGEDIGATGRKLAKREKKAEDLLIELKAELAATPASKIKRRAHLKKRIAKVEAKLERINAKQSKKAAHIAATTGKSMAEAKEMLDSGNVWVRRGPALRDAASQGFVQVGSRADVTGFRTNIHLSDSDTSAEFSAGTITAASGIRSTTVNLTSPQISYARVMAVGIRYQGTVQGAQVAAANPRDMAFFLKISTYMRDGQADQVFDDCLLPLNIVSVGDSGFRFEGEWFGLRRPIPLDKRDTATVGLSVIQAQTNAGNIVWTLGADMVVDVLSDDQG